jgi:Ca-activated chloride channel homolog
MTAEDRDARLTAYALNEPGLSADDRRELETLIAGDADARRAVEETRHLARVLTDALAAEQAALPTDKPVTIPAPPAARPTRGWVRYVVAAAVLIAVGGGSLAVWSQWKGPRANEVAFAPEPRDPAEFGQRSAERSPAPNPNQGNELTPESATHGDKPAEPALPTPVATSPDDPKKGGKGDKDTAPTPGDPVPAPELPAPGEGKATAGSGTKSQVPGAGSVAPAGGYAPGGPRPGIGGPGTGTGVPGPGGPAAPGGPPAPDTIPPPSPPGTQPSTEKGAQVPGRSERGPMPAKPSPRPDAAEPKAGAPAQPVLQAPPAKSDPGKPDGGRPRPDAKPEPRRDAEPAKEGKPGEGGEREKARGDDDDKQKDGKKGEKEESRKELKDGPVTSPDNPGKDDTNDRFPRLIENGFVKVQGLDALSTFGVDVDTASYAIVRKYLTAGQLPPANAVRLEELVNYFPYQDKAPTGDDPFAVTVEMAECPWQPNHRLVRLGLKAKPIDVEKRPVSNLVFLIDVSGSMNEPNKLPLVKESMKLLVNQLGENDRVAMVVYAGASGLVLDSTSAVRKDKIIAALENLSAGGSTNGAGGLQQAYDVATANFIKGGTNRVILCTDGDWNVGTTSTEGLVKMVEQKRETGVFLSVFGFGMGNLRDEMMVKLAGKGNGNYGYIDTIKESQKLFVEQLSGTLVTVAKDVKVQIEFNPAAIQAYRLLGYEKRHLEAQDFADDKKDAGEMGAGHVVTALYELVPVGAPTPAKLEGLRYQQDPAPAPKVAVKGEKATEAFVVKMRHKKPDGDKSTLRELPVSDVTKGYEQASEDFRFSASVASFAMLLRDSAYKGNANYAVTLELAEAAKKHDPGGYRAEFIDMVKKARTLSGKP